MDSRYDFIHFFTDADGKIYSDNKIFQNCVLPKLFTNFGIIDGDIHFLNTLSSVDVLFYSDRLRSRSFSNDKIEYYVVPNMRNPRWLVASEQNGFFCHGLIIKPTSFLARFVWGLGKALSLVGKASILFPDRVIVQSCWLEKFTGNRILGRCIVLYTGSPGRFQKFTLLCQSDDNKSRYYVKTSNTLLGKGRIVHEKNALNDLADIKPQSFCVPRVLDSFDTSEFYGIVTNDIVVSDNMLMSISDADFDVILELYNKAANKNAALGGYFDSNFSESSGLKNEVVATVLEKCRHHEIILFASHGDYIPWNRFVSNEPVKVIDWETYSLRPAYYDIVYFIVHASILIDFTSIIEIERRIFDTLEIKKVELKNVTSINAQNITVYILACVMEIYCHYSDNGSDTDLEFLSKIESLLKSVYNNQDLYRVDL